MLDVTSQSKRLNIKMRIQQRHYLFIVMLLTVPFVIMHIRHNGIRFASETQSAQNAVGNFENRRFVKRIYFATDLFRKKDWLSIFRHWSYDRPYRCESGYQCQVTKDSATADALLFHAREISSSSPEIHSTRTATQRWIFFSWESIAHSKLQVSESWRYKFNWTATYMKNSDILAPYIRGYVKLLEKEKQTDPTLYKVSDKTHFAFAVISNCRITFRNQIMESLMQYMPIDIYGKCGKPLKDGPEAIFDLSRRYRFYISFENSLCRDYITEKFWSNGLQGHAIPVVYGGLTRKDFDSVAPPHSFIYARDYRNARQLAEFLLSLSKNEAEYAQYFEWKKNFKLLTIGKDDILMCRLCERLNTDSKPSVRDVNAFWNKDKECIPVDLGRE